MQLASLQSESGINYTYLFLLSSILIFTMASFGIITPILAEIQEWGGLSATQVGFYFSAFGLARLFIDLPAGYIIDRFDGRWFTILSILTIMAGSLLSALAPTYLYLFAARLITGVGSAFTAIAVQKELLLLTDTAHRASVISYSMIARRMGASIFPFFGGVLAAVFTWRAVFYFCLLLNLLGLAIICRFSYQKNEAVQKEAEQIEKERKKESSAVMKTVQNKAHPLTLFLIYALAFVLFVNRNGLERTVIPLFGISIGIDSVMIGFTLSFSGILSVLAVFLGGRLADRYGRKVVVVTGLLILLCANGLFLVIHNFALYFLANMFFALAAFTMVLPMTIAADLTPSSRIGQAVGVIRLFNDGGLVAGPIFLSWVMDAYSFSASIWISMLVLLFVLLMVTFFLKESSVVQS